MRLQELFEKEIKGAMVKPGAYSTLYHITDYQGFSVSVSKNSLNAFRQDYISTTWDPTMNAVGGRDHYHFKFVLNGDKCLTAFPANRHKSYAKYSDGSGHHDWDEREVALQTKSISPLNEYVTGLTLLVPIYSRSFIQWMFYEIKEWHSFMGNKVTDSAPKGIESLRVVFKDWGIPLSVYEQGAARPLNQKEKLFINSCFKLIRKGMHFDKALKLLVDEYPEEIADHFDGPLTSHGLRAAGLVPKYLKQINNAIGEKDIYKMNTNKVRVIIQKMLKELGYDEDSIARVIRACEENQMFHPMVEPVNWSTIIRGIVKNRSINAIIDTIGWVGENKVAPAIKHFWEPKPRWGTRRHYKTFDGKL